MLSLAISPSFFSATNLEAAFNKKNRSHRKKEALETIYVAKDLASQLLPLRGHPAASRARTQ